MDLLLLNSLLLLAISAVAKSQSITINQYIGDEIIHVTFPGDAGTKKTIGCPPKTGLTYIGIQKKGGAMLTRETEYEVDLSYTVGNYDDLQRLRQTALGPYHCLYQSSAGTSAFSMIVSEVPRPGSIRSGNLRQIGTNTGENVLNLYCTLPNREQVVWERLNDKTGLFELYREGDSVERSFSELAAGHGDGFTIYRCYSKRVPEQYQYIHATYAASLLNRPVRPSNYSATTVPYIIRYESRISLECHGNGTTVHPVFQPRWWFRQRGTDEFKEVDESDPRFAGRIEKAGSLTTLVVEKMTDVYDGFYKCRKDDINHHVELRLSYGDVIIRDYSKDNYDMKPGVSNYITCLIPEKSKKEEAFWVLRRRGQPSITLKGGQSQGGLTASFDATGDLQMAFSGSDEFIGARLECKFYGSADYTMLRKKLPKLTLADKRSSTSYYFVECTKDTDFGTASDMKVFVLENDGSKGLALRNYGRTQKMQQFYGQRATDKKEFARLICEVDYNGILLKSEPLLFGKPPIQLDIIVDGSVNPGNKVFLSGRDVDIQCHFSTIVGFSARPDGMRLLKDGNPHPSAIPKQLNETTYETKLVNPSVDDTGMYQCHYTPSKVTKRQVSNPIPLEVKSSESRINFCSSSQFVCDGMCKDGSLMCDKKKDCTDGYDEREEYCDKCEPNAVKCEIFKGTMPSQRCVLKHWLCDGQDDCGNGFDEDTEKHKAWCYKDAACSDCKPHETCCPNTKTCIWRSYECDKERDCTDSIDEEVNCAPSDCLRLEAPDKRIEIKVKEGDSIRLRCVAVGMDRPTTNWRFNWGPLPEGFTETNSVLDRDGVGKYRVEGILSATATAKMSGIYNCEAINNCKRELSYELTIKVE